MAVIRGIMLGAVNLLVIAIGMGVMVRDSAAITLVVLFGCIPAVVAGGVLGWFAQRVATHRPYLRAMLLVIPAIGVVFFLAAMFEMGEFALVACIPTITAALILERWTRRTIPAPIPVATVRAMRGDA